VVTAGVTVGVTAVVTTGVTAGVTARLNISGQIYWKQNTRLVFSKTLVRNFALL